jgi:flagellar assembly protein FliH
MTAPRRFLFDTEFGTPKKAEPPVPMITLVEHEATLATAVAEAYRRGVAEGRGHVEAQSRQAQAAALQSVAQTVAMLSADLSALESRLEQEAVGVAVAVAARLAPALVAREPQAEMEALARACFTNLRAVPHVAVRVPDATFETARHDLDRIARESGFEGRLIVLADPDMGTGDVRIEWADGGIVRERATVEAAIDDMVSRYLVSRDHTRSASDQR